MKSDTVKMNYVVYCDGKVNAMFVVVCDANQYLAMMEELYGDVEWRMEKYERWMQ